MTYSNDLVWPIVIPSAHCVKLTKKKLDPDEEEPNLSYRELLGPLTYLAVTTRPDISYTVSYLKQFNNYYDQERWTVAKQVLRYLKRSRDLGLVYHRDSKPVEGFVDADWGSCPEDRWSYTDFLFKLSGSLISWDFRKQPTVALSSIKAEYMGLTKCTKEAIYLQKLLDSPSLRTSSCSTIT